MQKIVSLAKRRGFIFPSSEIYGGLESSYDFGPLGVEMKNNIKKAWWDEMTKVQKDIMQEQNRPTFCLLLLVDNCFLMPIFSVN